MRPATARAAAAFALAVTILAAVSFLAQAHPDSSTDVIGEGDDLWDRGILLVDKGRWAEALPVHEQIVKVSPDYAEGWLGLARSLNNTGKRRESLPAYRKALELGARQPFRVMLELAQVHAALGETDAAIDWLEQGVRAKAPSRQRLLKDEKLASLRGDPRFRAIALDIDASKWTREEGWRADLDLFAGEFKRLHYAPFRQVSEVSFDRAVADLKSQVGRLDDDAIAVRLMQLVAPHADGHTQILPAWRFGSTIRLAPMQFDLDEEGLYVLATRPEDEALLWGRVVEVNGTPTGKVLEALASVISRDNAIWLRARAPFFVRFPRLLKALGQGRSAEQVDYTIVTRTGERRTVPMPTEGRYPGAWSYRPRDHAAPVPLYLTRRNDNYWFEHLPAERLVYFQFNSVMNKKAGEESLEAFAKRLAARIDQDDVERVVVDLRHNGGGNTGLIKPLTQALLGTRKLHKDGALFVIAGRGTFSAAMNFAAQLERHAVPMFAGEPTGSSPNFIGENSELTLPYSKLQVSISNLYWQNGFPQDHRTWIAPLLHAPPTLASLVAGRDPALEAIRAYLREREARR